MLTIFVGVLALCSIAIINNGPFYFDDTIGYLRTAQRGLDKLLGTHLIEFEGDINKIGNGLNNTDHMQNALEENSTNKWTNRSIYYGFFLAAGTLLGSTATVIFAQAVLCGWLCFLACKLLMGHLFNVSRFLTIIFLISTSTSVAFFCAYLMPDIFFAFSLLITPLLFIYRDSMRRLEHSVLIATLVVSCLFHSAVPPMLFMTAAMSVALARLSKINLAVVAPFSWIVFSCLVGVVGNWIVDYAVEKVYGRPGLRPPFALARVVSDGPGTQYLNDICDKKKYVLCAYRHVFPTANADVFLWSTSPEDGVLAVASSEDQMRIVEEQFEVVVGAILSYPVEQIIASSRNFARQVVMFTVADFRVEENTARKIRIMLPSHWDSYSETRAVLSLTDFKIYANVHLAAYALSLAWFLFVLLSGAWRKRYDDGSGERQRASLLLMIIIAGLLANAALSGILSEPHHRYGSRVIWILPMVAMAMMFSYYPLGRRRPRSSWPTTATPPANWPTTWRSGSPRRRP